MSSPWRRQVSCGAVIAPTTKREQVVGNSGTRGTQEPARMPHRRSILPARRLAPKSPKRRSQCTPLRRSRGYIRWTTGAYLVPMTGPASQPRKPVVLTVDDDPAVSRAVARDLRRHYGENYRIVRAESGPDALETLAELKLRGDTVAVFVADYRMPQMSGIEFLEEAMDLYPLARRVLLTAYADTHAAIDAINVVDLDHYLLKPWDPPEEKLYPVIDGLLEAWHATGDRAIPHTKVIGHRWNERSWEVRQFLARNQHSFRSFMADEPKGKQLLDAAGLDGYQLPVVITEQGETLVEPSNGELAAMLGLSTSPSLEMYELAVIGGGPAGLAAAVYGASEGLKTVLIEETTT